MGYTDWLVDYCDSYLYRGGNWAAGGTSTGKKRKVDDDSCFDRGDNWAAAGTTTGEKRKVDDDVSKWTSVDGEWRPRPPAPPPPPEYFDKMAAFYLEAIRRLPVADMPYLARCVCFGGLTVGLADPVNNIILSAIVLYVHSHLSAVKVKLPATKESFLDVARRSYAGAVFFMQYHFRYLTKARAAHYLRLAGQDLALATQLVQSRRLNGVFHTDLDPRSPRIRSALKLAACEAKYPVPDHLVRFMVWSVPLPLLNPILDDLQQGKALSLQRVAEIMYLLRHLPAIISDTDPLGGPDLGHFSCLTSSSISKERRMLSTAVREAEMAADPDEELYTKMEEQDIAHLMYIKALSVLPTDALRQHGLLGAVLKAGHCCGPFHPVVNIVFNSICYKAGVLRLGNETQAAEDDVLDTRSMTPIESCFCHSQKLVMSSLDISLKQPLQRLQDQVVLYRRFLDKISLPSKGKFHDAAITYFRNLTHEQIYELCSILAKHDFFNGPDQHNQFMPLGSDSLASLEKALSLQPIGVFNSLLENEPRVQQMSCYQAPQQHFVRTQLENLLLEYSRSSHWGSEYNYKLGLICGVASAQYGCTKICYHVNFLASVCEDERSELFFAEFWFPSDLGMEDSTKRPMCCPIDHLLSELGRCFICEAGNSRLVHPSSKEYFLGKTIAFEDLCMIARKGASAVHDGTSDHHGAEYKDSA